MFKLKSAVKKESDEYRANLKANQEIINEFKEKLLKVAVRNDHPHVIRHRKRGRLLARERVNLLIDPRTPFLEFSALAANGQYQDNFPSAGIITGLGMINGNCLAGN